MQININEHNNNAMHNDDERINNNGHITPMLINMRDSYVKAIMAIRTACISPAIKDKESRILDVLRGLDAYADYLHDAYVAVSDDDLLSSLNAVENINDIHLKYLKTGRISNVPEDIPTDKDIEVARQCIDRLVNAHSTSELTMDEIVNLDKVFYHAYPKGLISGK